MLAGLVIIGWLLGSGAPAEAQVVCRSNTLGAEVCTGVPAPSMRNRPSPPRQGRGLAGVQPRPVQDAGTRLVPARRTDSFGATYLGAGDLPPRRPPLPGVAGVTNCKRDALGNLLCD